MGLKFPATQRLAAAESQDSRNLGGNLVRIMGGIMGTTCPRPDKSPVQVDLRRVGLYGQADHEITVVFVEFELWRRRAIFFHGSDDFRDAGGSAFGEFEFLQELADAAIAIPTRVGFTGAELCKANGAVGAGIAEHDQLVLVDADFDRLTHFVAAVVDRVDDRFLDHGIGEVFGALRNFAVRTFAVGGCQSVASSSADKRKPRPFRFGIP